MRGGFQRAGGNFGGDGDVHSLDGGGGLTGAGYTCQNGHSVDPQPAPLIACQL